MVTTSHSAPYEATSDEARIGLVDSWVRSSNIDYLSPQLYTTGGEGAEFAASTGQLGDVGYEHYVGAKAKFVPSIVSEDQVDEVREYFAEKGIEVRMRNTIALRLGSMRLLLSMLAHDPDLELHVLLSFTRSPASSSGSSTAAADPWTRRPGCPRCPRTPTLACGKTPEEIAADVNCMAHGICGVFMR